VKLQYAPHRTRPAGVVYPDFPVEPPGSNPADPRIWPQQLVPASGPSIWPSYPAVHLGTSRYTPSHRRHRTMR